LVVILVELDVGIPVILPKKTLDNFLHNGYIVSFIGLLDLCMSSNKSLADLVDELQGEEVLSEISIRTRCAFAVLGIGSRGMIACGLLYLWLGIIGYSGDTRRRLATRPSGLAKTPKRRQHMAST